MIEFFPTTFAEEGGCVPQFRGYDCRNRGVLMQDPLFSVAHDSLIMLHALFTLAPAEKTFIFGIVQDIGDSGLAQVASIAAGHTSLPQFSANRPQPHAFVDKEVKNCSDNLRLVLVNNKFALSFAIAQNFRVSKHSPLLNPILESNTRTLLGTACLHRSP